MHRLLTSLLPIIALAVALVLVGHDAAMAAGPHDATGAHATHHDGHGPVEDTACGELEAARTGDPTRDIDAAGAMPLPVEALPDPGVGVLPLTAPDPGAPRGQLRAMLQVWLN
jgi:hypothetical protein